MITGRGGDLDREGELGGEGDREREVETTDLGFLNFLVLCLLEMGEGDLDLSLTGRGLSKVLVVAGEGFLGAACDSL